MRSEEQICHSCQDVDKSQNPFVLISHFQVRWRGYNNRQTTGLVLSMVSPVTEREVSEKDRLRLRCQGGGYPCHLSSVSGWSPQDEHPQSRASTELSIHRAEHPQRSWVSMQERPPIIPHPPQGVPLMTQTSHQQQRKDAILKFFCGGPISGTYCFTHWQFE